MKIFDRIFLACGIVVAIGAAQNAFVLWDLSEMSGKIVEATTQPLLQVTAANRLSGLFQRAERQLADVTDAIHFVSGAESTTNFRQTIAEMNEEIVKLSTAGPSLTASRDIEGARRHLKDWTDHALNLLGDTPAAAIITPDAMERRKSRVIQDIGRLVESALDAARSAKDEMLDMTAASRRRSLTESLGAILAGVFLAFTSAISITRPMGRLKRSMARVAGGDLDAPIDDGARNDEIGVMARALEFFREQALNVRALEENERTARALEAAQELLRSEDLKKRHASFQLLFVSNPVSMWVHDANTGRIIAVNDAAVKHYGYSRKEFLSMSTSDLGWSDAELTELEPTSGDTHWHRKADGAEIEVAIFESFLTYDGCAASLIAAIDLTDRRRAERKILHLAHHDALTDLPNRFAFDAQLASALHAAAASSEPMAVLCLDVDGFKEVNDVFGHAFGDKLLKELSYRMSVAADGAFVARTGGDEFTIISVDRNQPAASKALAERLSAVVSEDFDLDEVHVRVGFSIGVAVYPDDGLDAASLVANADAALYRAKNDDRGGVRFFESEMDRRIRERHALQVDLRAAMERRELTLHYQPQATIAGEIFGFEALVRWRHPIQGFISPATFIPIAEETGLIASLGEWVLREACREAASWPKKLRIAINLSPLQFRRGDLPGLVHSVLFESGLAPGRLELEITEGVLMQDASRSLMILRRLKSMGVMIAMDDFGTGYSSMSYLQSFPFDKIKIDQSFIRQVKTHPQSAAIVRAVIGLGRNLGMRVIAEGVETTEQLAFLSGGHCDEVQGYLIGRPMPIEDYSDIVVGKGRRVESKGASC
jgi:diguanylate cyclase (GGDEF)-like protein/PAS domain S-box-containing protein